MQKRVVYNFNAQTATESAAENSTDKAVKTSNAIGKIKRAFSGKSFKLVVLIVLLFASLFCAIGSADWIISQQKVVPNVAGNSIFKFDDLGFGAHVNNGKPTGNYTFNGSSISISMSVAAVGGVQNLPDSAIEAQNIRYRVKNCASDTKPENLNEEFFNSDYTTVLPKYAGTYAVLITSEADGVSYGKTIKVFTIAPCPVKIEWSGAVDFTYDGTDHSSNITATARTENGAAVNENIFKISFRYKAHGATTFTPVTEVKNAGTYTATAEISNNNYTISSNEAATFTIEQKALTVTAEDKTVTYGDPAHYAATYKGLLDCDKDKLGTPNFTCNYNKVGTYSITVDGLENLNYAITYVNGTLTVNARTVTLDWGPDNSFIYDGNAHTLKPDAKNVVNNDNLGLAVTITGENISGSSAINVGTYTATAQITNENYVLAESSKTATFTITARALTITADNKTVTYGDPVPIYTLTYDGLLDCDKDALGSLVFKCEYTTTSPVGTYPITVNGLANSNYTISYKPGTLTVNPGKITVTVKSKTISYGDFAPTSYDLTCDNADINANISALGTPVFKCDYTTTSPVGKYTIEVSGLTLANYDIGYNPGTLYVKQRQVTVSDWGNTSFTYNGKAQKPEPSFNNVVNGDNLNATVTIIGDKQPIIKGNYTATVTIANDNYKLSGSASTNFTIIPLKIAFNGIIESDYKSGGIALNAELFNGKFKINETIADASSVDLSTVHNDIIGGTAKNFSGNEDTSKTENGFYSYAFGKNITAGSTYLISNITLDPTSNFELTTKSVYLKYKTAKVGNTCYTIEDALAQSGTITLCGDASNDSSYVITAFARFNNLSGTGFENYKANYEYALKSNSTLLLPYNSDGLAINSDSDIINCATAPEYVYSVLIIPQEISFTISGTLDIGGRLSSKGGDFNQARVKQHSVVYNNGNIVVTNRINSYGYLKGANDGLVELQSTATALDIMLVYDWLAGTEAIQIHNAGIFPFKSYSIHNISCKTKIMKGAKYLAKAALNIQDMLLPSEPITIVGTSGSMFTVESGYIVKTASNADSNKASTDLTSITGTNQLKGQKDIITLGENTVCHDNSITLNVQGKKITTSKDYPLPISYINLVVPNTAKLTLNAVSYLFYPGSSLKVETGGNLVVEKVSVAFYTLKDCITDENWGKNRVKYATAEGTNDYAVDRTDAKLSIDAGGTATIKSNASISGCITATNAQAQLIINSSTSVTVKVTTNLKAHNEASFWDKMAIAAGTISASITTKTYTAFGDIMTSQNSYAQRNLSTGTYYSKKVNGKFVWYSQTATITYKANGITHSTISRTVGANGYTITAADFPTTSPTKDYYTFDKWYIDEALTTEAVGKTVFISCTLYAGWTANTYSITYKYKYNGGEYENVDNSANKKTYTYEDSFFLAPAISNDGYKFYRWYSDEACTEPITQISGMGNNITIYGEFIDAEVEVYVVTYVNSNNEVDTPSAENVKSTEAANFKPADLGKITNDDTSKSKYFLGWYIDEACKTLFNGSLTGSVTLYAGWDNKAELSIVIPNSTHILEAGVPTGKYYYKGQSVVIPDISTHPQISAMYTVPEGYKFIGFLATAGCTTTLEHATDASGYITGITTNVTVSNDLSKGLTITADIRKILKVDITMTASAKPLVTEKGFEINKITVSANSFYSKTNSDDWLISDGSTDIKQLTKGTQTFYLLEGSTDITVTINTLSFPFGVKRDAKVPETTGCLTNDSKSPFTFTIKENNATIKWEGQQS